MALASAVVLSYNRQDVLRRQLLYYANKPVHLIFADGSDRDWGSGESGSIGEMTWEYFRISGPDSVQNRFTKSVSKVKTEFVFFIDDEECILWTGVERAVEFLKKNSDHSCAGGRADIMERSRCALMIRKWDYWGEPLALLQSKGVARLDLVFSENRTANIYYQVLRASDLKLFSEALDTPLKLKERYPGFIEIALTGFLLLIGKWEMGEYPYWFRFQALSKHSMDSAPTFLKDTDVEDLVFLYLKCLKMRTKANQTSILEFDGDQIEKILKRCFGQQNSNKSFIPGHPFFGPSWHKGFRGKIFRILFRISRVLFQCAPLIYEFLYSRGWMSVKAFANTYSKVNPIVFQDIKGVERIWFRFPYGLSVEQLSEELMLRANI